MKTLNFGGLVAAITALALLTFGTTSCNAKTHVHYVAVPVHHHTVLVPNHHTKYVLVPVQQTHSSHQYVVVPAHGNTHISRNGNLVKTVVHHDGTVTRTTTLKNGRKITQHLH